MSHSAALAPGLSLAFLVGLSIIVLVPLAGWMLLAGRRTRAVQVWYSGLAAFALASLVFTLTPLLGQDFVELLPGTLALTCLVLLTESLRLEVQEGPTRWKMMWLPVAYLLLQWALLQADRRGFEGVLLQQALILGLVLRLLWWLSQMRHIERSRGLMFIHRGTLLLAFMNVLRMGFIFVEGRDPGLLGLTPVSNLFFVGSVLTPVFWGLGYWGFVLESTSRQAALAAAQVQEEARRLKTAQEHAQKLEALIHERDRMILLNSRFAAINHLAVFNGGIVHEITQPLQSMSLSLQEMAWLVEQPVLDAQAMRDEIGKVAKYSQQAQAIIKELRLVIGSGSPRIERVKVRETIREVVDVVRSECQQRGVAFDLIDDLGDHDVEIRANRVLLQRVLFNLLGNAIHALGSVDTRQRTPAIVLLLQKSAISMDAPQDLDISVIDNGPGLPPHVLAAEKVLSDSGKKDGLGFGLTLVKSLMALWGGELFINSPVPDNTDGTKIRLIFRLPRP